MQEILKDYFVIVSQQASKKNLDDFSKKVAYAKMLKKSD